MKNFINKFKYVILGAVLLAGLVGYKTIDAPSLFTAGAVQVSVPAASGEGYLLQSGTNGRYNTVSLTAGTNVTLSTSTSNITINASGGGSGSSAFEISTTSGLTVSQLAYFTKTGGMTTLGGVSTTTLTAGSGLSGSFTQLGSGGSVTCATSNSSTFGCLTAAKFSEFDSATTTAGTGLTYSGNAFNVNTSQNIATLSNLTTNGLVYTAGSGGTLNVTSTSTPTIGGSLSYSGTAGFFVGGSSGTLSLNMANANTWSALQTFTNSSTTLASFTYASTTGLRLGTGQGSLYTGSNGVVGVTATTSVTCAGTVSCTTFTALGSAPITLTGSGGGGSVSTSTVDWIIYKKGTNTVVYDTVTNSDALTTTSFGAACNYIVNQATSTFPARVNVDVRTGYYNAVSDCVIDGNSNQYGPTFNFNFVASSTEVYVATGVNAFRFQNQASANIINLTCGVAGTAKCLFATTTSGTQSSLRESYIKGLNVHATTTHTGWAIDLINPFRNHFESVDLKFVGNGVRVQCNTSGFNCGDTTYERGFTEILNSSIGYMVKLEGNAGTHNQDTFIDWNGISNDTNDVMWYFKKSNWNRVLGSNSEEFATSTEFYNSNANTFISNKYMNIGNNGGTVVFNDANSYNNSFSCKYVEITSSVVLMRDLNTVATTRPNAFGNFEGGVCTIGDDGGTVSFATTTSSVVANIHDNITGALSYLNSTKLTGNKLHFNWNSVFTTFLEYAGSALRFIVGGNEILNLSSTGGNASLIWDFGSATSLEIPNNTSPTMTVAGRLALDTTANNLIQATSTTGHFVVASATTTLASFTVASTSIDFVSGGIIPVPAHFLQEVATAVICSVDGGTSQQIFFSDGTNDTNTITCTTTETQYALTSNNTWNAYETKKLEFATKSGSPDYVTIRLLGYRVSN